MGYGSVFEEVTNYDSSCSVQPHHLKNVNVVNNFLAAIFMYPRRKLLRPFRGLLEWYHLLKQRQSPQVVIRSTNERHIVDLFFAKFYGTERIEHYRVDKNVAVKMPQCRLQVLHLQVGNKCKLEVRQ